MADVDCNAVVSAIRKDVAFLREEGLMDYSLLVGVVTKNKSDPAPLGGVTGQPYTTSSGPNTHYLYVGVIDFLQVRDRDKKTVRMT